MRKQWLWISIMGLLLTACESTPPPMTTLPPLPQTGPATEVSGVEPRYEPYNVGTLKDYKVNGKNYRIVTQPENFSEIGLATWYGKELHGNRTASGEIFDANELTAAHPTLPLPSYVRVTNLSNGRQLIVRVNDRGPFTKGRIIDLSKAAAERLNVTNQTKVRLDVIVVAPNGTLSGPGTIGSTVAKRSYNLPGRPTIGSPTMLNTAPANTSQLSAQQDEPVNIPAQPDNNLTLSSPTANDHSLILNAPQSEKVNVPAAQQTATTIPTPSPDNQSLTLNAPQQGDKVNIPAAPNSTVTVPAPLNADNAQTASSASASYMVQVSAVNDRQRAVDLQTKLSSQLNVPGKVSSAGALYRIQLGPFSTRQQAQELQQRLSGQGQPNSFIMTTSL
ncbi:Rare lipoprotein A precursor [Pragia fontium]|uniref:endolytic peptidoglycan transglycosylase RlpA n=1 Tax=Pragia fontium TaxID=82985 RepID=UPI000DFCF813|nr:endolytic peptidoglycan transglycosylase RlpA [Pragia fontium]SUB82083.1 Rare lipoprotein A precursor [Pragia fontium]